MLENAAHFAVAPLFEHHIIPFVRAFPALAVDTFHPRQAVFQHHALAGEQAHLVHAQLAQHAHRILALHFEARVGKTVGQLAGSGKNQQAAGIDIQAADGYPTAARRLRQAVENAHAPLRVVARHNLAFLLVIQDDTRQSIRPFQLDHAAFHQHLVFRPHLIAQLRHLAVHRYPTVLNPFLHLAARTRTRSGQCLLQAHRLDAAQIGTLFLQTAHLALYFLVSRAHRQLFCPCHAGFRRFFRFRPLLALRAT